jgi:hypothetical protein
MKPRHRIRLNRIQAAGLFTPQLAEQIQARAGKAIDDWIAGISLEAYETLTTTDLKKLRASIERVLREDQ